MSWKCELDAKMMSLEDAAKLIESGDKIWAGWFTCIPTALVNAVCARKDELTDVDLVTCVLAEPVACMQSADFIGHIAFHSMFVGGLERKYYSTGNVHFNSVNFSQSNLPLRDFYKVNTLLAEMSEPDEEGYVYFGPQGGSWGGEVAEYAEKIIVSINSAQPRVRGIKQRLHISQVSAFCRDDHPLHELHQAAISPKDEQIASYIIPKVPDGACLQVGLGGIANCVAYGLRDKKNMSIHTEMLTDSLADLINRGAVNGRVLAGFGFGTQVVHDAIAAGKCELAPIDYVNHPPFAGENDNFVSINSCLMVDLTGQVASESIGYRQFSSTGGQLDYVLACHYSKGGQSFLCCFSTYKGPDGEPKSSIMLTLPPGQAVTTPRSLVMYVVTEYGIADLRNKPLDQRTRELIRIAHPDFRDELTRQAKEHGLLP